MSVFRIVRDKYMLFFLKNKIFLIKPPPAQKLRGARARRCPSGAPDGHLPLCCAGLFAQFALDLLLRKLARAERSADTGELKLGVIPTVAPYVLPQLFRAVLETLPGVLLRASESRTELLVRKLKLAELDVALMSTPIEDDELLQIPLYYEKFLAYVSPGEPLHARREIDSREMPSEHLWVLQEGHCLRNQVMNLCGRKSDYSAYYEAGSIDTLVRIVDLNGGYTVIPELHVALLREAQKSCVRPLVNPEPVREISFVIRRDFVRERLLNRLADVLRAIIPEPMLDMRLKKFAIRL